MITFYQKIKLFFKVVWYKFFRFLQKYSNKDLKDSAFHGTQHLILILSFNFIVIYFILSDLFHFGLGNFYTSLLMVIYIGCLQVLLSKFIMHNNKYISFIKEIANSKFHGKYGNRIVWRYIILTFFSLVFLLVYMSIKNGVLKCPS